MAEMKPGVILVCVDVSVFLCGVGEEGCGVLWWD